MVASGVPRPNAFDFGTEDQDIHQALLAMTETLTTVKDYLNFFVNDLWENMVDEDFAYLKQSALEVLVPQEVVEDTPQKWTINRLLNTIIGVCRQPQRLLDSNSGGIIRERIVIHHLNADVLNFEVPFGRNSRRS